MATVRDVLTWALPAGTRVVAGEERLDAPVSWARSVRIQPAPLSAIGPGEMLLLSLEQSGLGPADERSLALLVRDLEAAGASALAYLGQMGARAVSAAHEQRFPLLQLPPGSDLLVLEQRVIALLVDREAGLRRRIDEVQDRLLASLREDRGPRPLLEALAAACGKAVVALDEYLQPWEGVGLDDQQLLQLARALRSTLVERWDHSGRVGPPKPIQVEEEVGDELGALAVPLVLRDTPVGALCLVGPVDSLTEFDQRILERASSILALEVAKQRAVEQAQLRLHGDLLTDLLSGHFPSDDAMRARARWLGYDLFRPHRVAILAFDDPGSAPDVEQRLRAFVADVARSGQGARRLDGLLHIREGRLVAAVALRNAAAESEALAVADRLRLDLGAAQGGSLRVSAGVSRFHPGLQGFATMYREAKQALRAAQGLLGGNCAVGFASLGVHRLLAELLDSPELVAYFQDHLGKLEDYDRRHNGELLATLDAFFAANGNHVRAARELHLHRNTLLYRLDRIQEILAVSLEAPETRLALQVALKLKHVAARSLRPADEATRFIQPAGASKERSA